MNPNPWESDLDIDEDTGEVVLPPGYTGRSGSVRVQEDARARGVGQPPSEGIRQVPGSGPREVPESSGAGVDQGSDDPSEGGERAPLVPHSVRSSSPCPQCSRGFRILDTGGSAAGFVVGLGILGGILWYVGRSASMSMGGGHDEELDLDDLPVNAPKMLSAPVEEQEEGDSVVEGLDSSEDLEDPEGLGELQGGGGDRNSEE